MAELDKINVNGELYDMSDSKARSDIASEITNRTNADKALDDKVKAETEARTSADNALNQKIAQETTNRTNADNDLQTAVNAETQTREQSDNALQEKINTNKTGIDNLVNDVAIRNVKAEEVTNVPEVKLPLDEVKEEIEAAGNRVLNSIPDDYTQINNKVSELKGDIDNLRNGITVIDLLDRNWNDNIGMDSWGAYISSSNSRYFGDGEVDVSSYVGETIHFVIDNTNTTSCTYSFQDVDGNKIERTSITESTDVIIPSNAKIFRLCVVASDSSKLESSKSSIQACIVINGFSYDETQKLLSDIPYIKSEIEKVSEIPQIKNDINNVIEEVSPSITETVTMINAIVNGTNGIAQVSDTSLLSKDYFEINDFENFTVDSNNFVFIYEYAEDYSYIGSAKFGALRYLNTTDEPIKREDITFDEGAKYFRLQVRNDRLSPTTITPDDVSVTREYIAHRISKLEEEVSKTRYIASPNYSYALNKILCIGDSLTSGAYYGTTVPWSGNVGTSIKQNYPSILGRMLCCDTINGGVSGIDSTMWYKQKYETIIDDTEQDENKWFDSVVIWLGTNGGYTDTFATDVQPYGTNYEQYADTAVGNLCKIIQRIKTNHPNRFMAICTLFTEPNASKASNKVILEVAEYYGLLLIDMSDLTYENYPNLHYGMKFIGSDGSMHSNPHFNKAGNIFIADRIARRINEYLSENLLSCDFGLKVRDDEYYIV